MRIINVPALKDNYCYLLDDEAGHAVAVDPSEAGPVLRALKNNGLVLEGIWCTHHHWDHVGGINDLVAACGPVQVIGSDYDYEPPRIPRQTTSVSDGTVFEWRGARVVCMEIPGHTLGAVAYQVQNDLFTGDTLFLAGCGRVFEGTMPMMRASLAKLRSLPDDTRIYCGHEYTVRNLEFAALVEPDSQAIRGRLAHAQAQRARGEATVPATLREERATNPFLRWEAMPVRTQVASWLGRAPKSDDEVFTVLRERKDTF